MFGVIISGMSGGLSRVYSNKRNVDIGGGVDKSGLPGSVGIPAMLRRLVSTRAPHTGKTRDVDNNSIVDVDNNSGSIYNVGGIFLKNRTYRDMEKYNGTSWTSAPVMLTPRTRFGLAELSGNLYAIGGEDDAGRDLSSVEMFDGTSWTSAPPMNTARRNLGVGVLNGLLYAVGGSDGVLVLSSVERFDGTSWTSAPPMNEPRFLPNIVVYNGLMYAIGGTDYTSSFGFLNSVEKFDGTSWVYDDDVGSILNFTSIAYQQSAIYDK